jgi:hypothetical protein
MKEEKSTSQVFRVSCPVCHSLLWIDPQTRQVIKSEKGKKKKGSLDDLLLKERQKKQEFERKFEATSEMQEERRKKANQIFKKALTDTDKE